MPAFSRTDSRRTGKARVLTQKALWQTFRAEAKGRNAVLDTACNRTMVGERALEDIERHLLARHNLKVKRIPTSE